MQNKYNALKTIALGILINFASDAISMVAPALG